MGEITLELTFTSISKFMELVPSSEKTATKQVEAG